MIARRRSHGSGIYFPYGADLLHFALVCMCILLVVLWRREVQHTNTLIRNSGRAYHSNIQVSYSLVENMDPLRAINGKISAEQRKQLKPFVSQWGLKTFQKQKQLTEDEFAKVWTVYGPQLNCPTVQKIGHPLDGDTRVCGLMTFLRHLHCVVYLFAPYNHTVLEEHFLQFTPCEMHVFAPLATEATKDKLREQHERIVFHNYMLSAEPKAQHHEAAHQPPVEMKTLKEIMKDLKHEWIDVVVMNVGGDEFDIFDKMFSEGSRKLGNDNVKVPFSQLLLKVHVDQGGGRIIRLLDSILGDGFTIFHLSPDWKEIQKHIVDISFVRAKADGTISP